MGIKEHRPRMFLNKIFRKTLGPKGVDLRGD
jgi:hypothetical protein